MFDDKRCREILSLLRGGRAKKILIQVPEGLKSGVQGLADFLEKNRIEVVLSIEPCFGACDLRDSEAKAVGCDMLLHIGHADFGLETKVPVIYYQYFMDYDFIPLLRLVIKQIKYRKICLVSTIQFKKSLVYAKKFLEKNGFAVKIADRVLGCDVSDAKGYEKMVDCYLFIGSGRFHPLGLQESVSKPVLFLDIENRMLEDLYDEKDRMEIKSRMRIEKAKGMKTFGILLSTKPGQMKIKQAAEIKRKLEKAGKKAYVLLGDCFTPEKLMGLKIDALVNTACPRLRDDAEQFGKVILKPEEVNEL
jgi:2-(3-amino-3-carboxypropyl)histidine synthase